MEPASLNYEASTIRSASLPFYSVYCVLFQLILTLIVSLVINLISTENYKQNRLLGKQPNYLCDVNLHNTSWCQFKLVYDEIIICNCVQQISVDRDLRSVVITCMALHYHYFSKNLKWSLSNQIRLTIASSGNCFVAFLSMKASLSKYQPIADLGGPKMTSVGKTSTKNFLPPPDPNPRSVRANITKLFGE